MPGGGGGTLGSCSQRLFPPPLFDFAKAWQTGTCLEVKGAEFFSPGKAATREDGSRALLPASQAMASSWARASQGTARGRDSGSDFPCCSLLSFHKKETAC